MRPTAGGWGEAKTWEAKTWHGLARAVRRGLGTMQIQACLTATAINLKRLAAALLVLISLLWRALTLNNRTLSRSPHDVRHLAKTRLPQQAPQVGIRRRP